MNLINLVTCALGILTPILFSRLLLKGIGALDVDQGVKQKLRIRIVTFITVWVALVWGLTIAGVFSYQSGDIIPRYLFALTIPVLIGVMMLRMPRFVRLISGIPLELLVGVQVFRLLGFVFILVARNGEGPKDFELAGYGDILTGLTAALAGILLFMKIRTAPIMAWIFTMVGMLDLLNVARILLVFDPIWSNSTPSSIAAGRFPMMLVLGLVAPIALLLHVYAIRGLILFNKKS
ncbi:hypothetical protein EHO59_13795 [Leptospira semungkisensis]|uniref:Uncharacterized protein n=1 Tax=Leptospira semungkisensis TaxID=2484985 RepID=A0A4R9FSU4_9LEPT|nr:hypothetical protein [Leptospira semungkisensis]TGK00987.1 hypothetical protein EHO59_13795 [Leptospira semungkisensis]